MKITNTLLKTALISTALLQGPANAAAPFTPEVQPLGYIGPLELSNTDLSVNGAKAYRGWYENGAWQGDLIEYSVTKNGSLTTSIDLSKPSPEQGGTANWSAHVQFAAKAGNYWNTDTGRKIITSTNGTNQVAFRWDNLSVAQQKMVDSLAEKNGDDSSDNLDYLRGDRSNEKPSGHLRLRFSLMGDVIHSNPVYVGAPSETYSDPSYVDFQNGSTKDRAARVYVGANDGMLHAFDAATGDEAWAYIPSMVMHKLSRLGGTPYAHTYFVDGGLNVRDAYFGGNWRSVLVGSMGAGAKGLFGLDVTHPELTSESLSTGDNKKVLWELSAENDDDMGYIFDRSRIVKLNDGKWYAVNGNGVSSVNGKAILYLIDIGTGTVVKKISTNTGSTGSPNGLAAPALVDEDGDGDVDFAYAGDIDGDMWKFNLEGSTPGSWILDYQLFEGKASQPITLSPDVTRHPNYGYQVLFGTGRLYTDDDIKDTSVQSLYGVWDKGAAPTFPRKPLERILSADTAYSGGGNDEVVRTFTTTAAINYQTYDGWVVDLPAGERLVTAPQLRAGRLKTTITDPDGYKNFLLEVVFDEGSADETSIFDLDRSGTLDTADRVDGNIDGDLLDKEDVPMGWKRDDGNMSQVTIARLGDGIDTLFLNFLNPPLIEPACSGTCEGGFAGGHVDVDTTTNSSGLWGKTAHVHQYDDKTELTFIDYFTLHLHKDAEKLQPVDSEVDGDEEFIVLIANADWSPGGVLTLGTREYSVVEYQRIIQMALAKWDGKGDLTDPSGNSLIFTLNKIKAAGGTLRNSFDNQAIVAGGLIGTETKCVNSGENVEKDRRRGGALLLQLVSASHFRTPALGTKKAITRVTVQNPDDFKTVVVLGNGDSIELTEDLVKDSNIKYSDYEIFGGLVASNDDEFLYEATLFWHWDGSCYNRDNWEEDFVKETQGVTEEAYQEMLTAAGYTTFEELETKIAGLEACANYDGDDKDLKKAAKQCKEDLKDVLKDDGELYSLGLLVRMRSNGGVGGDGNGSGGGISGDPQVMSGKADNLGISKGLNTNLGRRTWIDIMPE
jgi:hypothetical protein